MKLKPAFLQVFLIILVVNSFTALGVQRVEASGTIYIKADGSIDPPTAPVTTSDNITYALNDNISQVIVERDNIVVDGGFHWLGGLSMKNALVLSGRSNVTVKNTQIWTLGTFVMGTYLAEAGIYVNYSAEISARASLLLKSES